MAGKRDKPEEIVIKLRQAESLQERRMPAAGDMREFGRQRTVRHGLGPERQIQTGIGAIEVRRPKVRDRGLDEDGAGKVRFTSNRSERNGCR